MRRRSDHSQGQRTNFSIQPWTAHYYTTSTHAQLQAPRDDLSKPNRLGLLRLGLLTAISTNAQLQAQRDDLSKPDSLAEQAIVLLSKSPIYHAATDLSLGDPQSTHILLRKQRLQLRVQRTMHLPPEGRGKSMLAASIHFVRHVWLDYLSEYPLLSWRAVLRQMDQCLHWQLMREFGELVVQERWLYQWLASERVRYRKNIVSHP